MAWSFTDRVNQERQRRLLAAPRFRTIIDHLSAEMRVTGLEVVPGKTGAVKGCVRPEFTLNVSPHIFDLFFNSPRGYRAQFHKSPHAEDRANSDLISHISAKLIDYAHGRTTKHQMRVEAIRRSLCASSAKIWIGECGTRSQRAEDIKHLRVDLEVEPWLGTARAYVLDPSKYPNPNGEILAVDGVKAPTGTILQVKGAFIDESGQEHVPEDKKTRSLQIHLFGFT